MLATGVRVVRGPDWIWENQGELIFVIFWALAAVDIYLFHSVQQQVMAGEVFMRVKGHIVVCDGVAEVVELGPKSR